MSLRTINVKSVFAHILKSELIDLGQTKTKIIIGP